MKILVIFSGSQGHFHGVKQFLDNINLTDEVIYASHIGMPEDQRKTIQYIHVNAPPAFLDYEFLHHQDTNKIIQLKSDQVYYHHRKQALKELVDKVQPEVIILDNHSYTDALILAELHRQSDIKIVFYQTRLSTALTNQSKYGGHKNQKFAFVSGKSILRRKKFRRWRKKVTMPGLNENHRITNLIRSLDFQQVELNRNRRGLNSLTYIPELILSGRDLSLHQEENQMYTGLCISEAKKYHRPDSQKKNVMVSSGSRSHTYPGYRTFLDLIKQLSSHSPNTYFSFPESFKEKGIEGHNSYYSWHTYHDHLVQADIHITHGGINSIKDSLACGVPMLICPLDWKSDQIHNALMFEKVGLAQTWNIKKDDLKLVHQKIDTLLEKDYPERIKEYVEKDRRKYAPEAHRSVEQVREGFLALLGDEKYAIRNW